jgi:hypothetical protein
MKQFKGIRCLVGVTWFFIADAQLFRKMSFDMTELTLRR